VKVAGDGTSMPPQPHAADCAGGDQHVLLRIEDGWRSSMRREQCFQSTAPVFAARPWKLPLPLARKRDPAVVVAPPANVGSSSDQRTLSPFTSTP